MIDQTKLPNNLEFVTYDDFNQVAEAIRTLVVRGAPAIGVSAAFGLALAALQSNAEEKDELIQDLENAKKILIEVKKTTTKTIRECQRIIKYNKYINLKLPNPNISNRKFPNFATTVPNHQFPIGHRGFNKI